jgi:(1->4)-alpha-D-glucan 1-alpha-D-glucosylmutase
VGAWPIDAERLVGYFEKAAREAKVHTSWLRQDAKYESALGEFVRAVVGDAELTHAVQQLVDELDEPARRSALSQVTLKLTAPGVPDIYQGNEVWRHDLTDPDNRRPVDFPALRDTLTKAATMSAGQVWRDADRDLQKLWLTRALLKLRASRPGAFAPGSDYAPLRVRGAHAEHVVAFARGGGEVITIVPRLLLRLGGGPLQARVSLPPGRYRDALTSAQVAGPELAVGPLLAAFPVAVLSRA